MDYYATDSDSCRLADSLITQCRRDKVKVQVYVFVIIPDGNRVFAHEK
jgi:hypothetical protein